MKVLIIDNEREIAIGLSQLLQLFCPQVKTVSIETATAAAIESISSYQPDLVFLDVELNEGTGFDLLKQLPEIHFQLVVITAHDKYALNAFRFSAIDFLVKPIDPEELMEAVKRAEHHLSTINLTKQLDVFHEKFENDGIKKIVLRDLDAIYFVPVKDILYCQANGPYTTFFLTDQTKIVVSKTLKDFEDLLDPFGFERTHHSYLVNLNCVKRFDKKDGGSLILEDNSSVLISSRKKDQVLKRIEKLS